MVDEDMGANNFQQRNLMESCTVMVRTFRDIPAAYRYGEAMSCCCIV